MQGSGCKHKNDSIGRSSSSGGPLWWWDCRQVDFIVRGQLAYDDQPYISYTWPCANMLCKYYYISEAGGLVRFIDGRCKGS